MYKFFKILNIGLFVVFLLTPLAISANEKIKIGLLVPITGNDKDETFFGRVMGPIYKMDDTDANNLLKTLLFALWALVQFRLGRVDLSPLYSKK